MKKLIRSLLLFCLLMLPITETFCQTEKNIASESLVSASVIQEGNRFAQYVIDGNLSTAWYAGPVPCWIQLDFGEIRKISKIHIFFHATDLNRYYQYKIDVSTDGKRWTQIVDMTENKEPETRVKLQERDKNKGHIHQFESIKVRFIRTTVTYNSANPSAHIYEIKVY